MFQKTHRKLAFLCSLITTCIVSVILLFCLFVSEQNMHREEEALFMLKANSLSFDLASLKSIDAAWYTKIEENGNDVLYLEINNTPAVLSSLLLSDEDKELVNAVKKHQENAPIRDISNSSNGYMYQLPIEQKAFEYKTSVNSYMIVSSHITKDKVSIDSLFIHSLSDFHKKTVRQRLCYLGIFLVSVFVLFAFSYYFTGHAMKPLMENHARQKQFVALASHELRSPLAVFKTGLSLLKCAPQPARAARIYDMMNGEITRMERLLNDMLFLSKAEQAALQYTLEPVNLAELSMAVYEKYREIAAKQDITLTIDVPSTASPVCLCDRQRMEQVIIILLDNALTYTPAGKSVTLGLSTSRNRFLLTVRDTGSGISDEEKEKIFDKFYQANTSHTNKNHFGLGLSIAAEICKSHNGSISVSDTPGGGCTFTVKLPK